MIAALLVFTVVLSLAVSAFCSGCETGFLSVRRGRILHMAREGGARAKVIYEAISDMGRTTTAILLGNNLANVCYSSAAAALCAESALGAAVLSAVSALALLFLGEFLPKLLFAARPLRRLLALAPYWSVFSRVFCPVAAVFQMVVDRLMPRHESKAQMTPETVLKVLKDRKDGVKLSEFERVLVGRILSLRSRGEFITPDTLLSALDEGVI